MSKDFYETTFFEVLEEMAKKVPSNSKLRKVIILNQEINEEMLTEEVIEKRYKKSPSYHQT